MASTVKFNMTRDISGYNGFGVMPAYYQYGVNLAQNVAQTIATVPSEQDNWIAIFSYTPGATVFVRYNGTAAAFSGTAGAVDSELNPIGRQVRAGDTISVITPDTAGAYVGVLFYAVMPYTN